MTSERKPYFTTNEQLDELSKEYRTLPVDKEGHTYEPVYSGMSVRNNITKLVHDLKLALAALEEAEQRNKMSDGNYELLKTAFVRELTDERVAVAAAYWLDCSPHERTEADGIILARYARKAMVELTEAEQKASKWEKAFDNADRQYLKKEKETADLRRQLAEAERQNSSIKLQLDTANELYERMKQEYLKQCSDNGVLRKALTKAQQTIARQQQKIDAALSWTWNCGEANMLEVIAALKGKEQIVLTFPNCPICNNNNTIVHPNKAGTWLCVPCNKVFEEGAQP